MSTFVTIVGPAFLFAAPVFIGALIMEIWE